MPAKSLRAKGAAMARAQQMTPAEERKKVRRIRAKKSRGKTLTREEAGALGAQASVARTRAERARARRAGRERAFEKEHEVETWTNKPARSRRPHLSPKARSEVRKIRAKQRRGKTLTRREAGKLGGATRAKAGSRKPARARARS